VSRDRADRPGGTGADPARFPAARSTKLIVREELGPAPPAGAPSRSTRLIVGDEPGAEPDRIAARRSARPRLRLDADGRVVHDIRPAELTNDLAGWIADDLVAPGHLDPAAFEDTFVAVVQDVDPGWTVFYRNTLAALATAGAHGGTNAGMAPVHDRAAALAVGPHVVELGCCFGFLSLRLAADGHRVTAVDLVPGTARLLAHVSEKLGTPVTTLAGNALAVPLQDASADTVFAVHLLEHLPRSLDAAVVTEMLRVARQRVVVAVPFEDEPAPAWGHVRTFDLDDLHALGAATGLPYAVDEHHGGWLTVEKRT
jgi:SAM-dependent methyltransferase